MLRPALIVALILAVTSCDDTTRAENRRLRAEVVQLRAERDRLRSEQEESRADGQAEPAAAPEVRSAPPSEGVWHPEWRKIALPSASVEFPGSPKRTTPTFEEWQASAGGGPADKQAAMFGPTGSVLEYSFAGGGMELAMAEVLVERGPYLSLQERVDGVRAGVLRSGPGEILTDKSSKRGRFRTIRLELKVEGGKSVGVVAAASKLRPGQGRFDSAALIYMAVAVWPTDDPSADLARRFLDSLELK